VIRYLKLALFGTGLLLLKGVLGITGFLLRLLGVEREMAEGAKSLRKRLKAKEVSQAQVELAARLGHADAALLFPAVKPKAWTGGLGSPCPGSSVEIEAALALLEDSALHARLSADWAERVVHLFEALYPDDHRPQRAIAAARAWGSDPSEANREAARSAAEAAGEIASAASDAADDARAEAEDAASYSLANARYAAAHAAEAASDAAHSVASFVPGVSTSEAQAAAWSTRDVGSNARMAVGYTAESAHLAAESEGGTGHAADLAHDAEADWQRLRLAAYVLGEVTCIPPSRSANP